MRFQLINKSTAELLGKIVMIENLVAKLIDRADDADARCRVIESRLDRVVSSNQLISEVRAAELLSLNPTTLARMRKSSPPPIQVIAGEGIAWWIH